MILLPSAGKQRSGGRGCTDPPWSSRIGRSMAHPQQRARARAWSAQSNTFAARHARSASIARSACPPQIMQRVISTHHACAHVHAWRLASAQPVYIESRRPTGEDHRVDGLRVASAHDGGQWLCARHRGATVATSRACVRLVHARRLLPTRAQRASVVSGTHTRRFAWWCDRVRMEWSMSERMRIESQMRGFCVMHG